MENDVDSPMSPMPSSPPAAAPPAAAIGDSLYFSRSDNHMFRLMSLLYLPTDGRAAALP